MVFPVGAERTVFVANDAGQAAKRSGGGVDGGEPIGRSLRRTMGKESRDKASKASARRRRLNPKHAGERASVYS